MEILAVHGSPHRGNTWEITRRFEEKLLSFGDVEFEHLHLKDMNIEPCRGCFACFLKGEDACPLKDELGRIRDKIEEADGVLFVSPVYALHVTHLMKRFIDRLAYIFHRPRYFGKYAVVISAAGNPRLGLKDTLKYMETTAGSWGFRCVGRLGYGRLPETMNVPDLEAGKKDRMDEVVGAFHRAIREDKPRKLKFTDHLWFRSVQVVYKKMREGSPEDYRYFEENGWLDGRTRWFSDHVVVNPLYDAAAKALAGWMGSQIEKSLRKHGTGPGA